VHINWHRWTSNGIQVSDENKVGLLYWIIGRYSGKHRVRVDPHAYLYGLCEQGHQFCSGGVGSNPLTPGKYSLDGCILINMLWSSSS